MSTEKFTHILKKIKGKSKVVYFHLMGEPLLHPDLRVFLDLCAEENIAVNITTNGSLLEKRLPELINKTALKRLNLSLHSLGQFSTEELHTKLHTILIAAKTLNTAHIEEGNSFLVSLRLWTSDDTGTTTQLITGIEKFFSLSPNTITEGLAEKKGFIIEKGIAIHTAETFDWPDLAAPEMSPRGFCYALRDQAGILVDGTVVPCCLDRNGTIALGNIFDDDWDDIINSPRARAIYDGFTARTAVEKLCKHCGYRIRFGTVHKL